MQVSCHFSTIVILRFSDSSFFCQYKLSPPPPPNHNILIYQQTPQTDHDPPHLLQHSSRTTSTTTTNWGTNFYILPLFGLSKMAFVVRVVAWSHLKSNQMAYRDFIYLFNLLIEKWRVINNQNRITIVQFWLVLYNFNCYLPRWCH